MTNWLATKDNRRAAVLVGIAGALYAIPLLLTNRPYVDDLGRALYGNGAWTSVGRPLADFVMILLNFGTPIADLAPLTQLLGVGAICLSCLLLYTMSESLKVPPLLRAVGCALFLFNPFLLENLSYRFDSFTQALSVLVALLAVAVPVRRPFFAVVISTILIVVSLCLYQVAVNLSLGAAVLLSVVAAERGDNARSILISFALRILAVVCGLFLYMVVVAILSTGGFSSPYADGHSDLISLRTEGLVAALANLRRAFDQIWNSFDGSQRAAAVMPVVLSFGYCFVLSAKTLGRASGSWERFLAAGLIAIAPVLIALAIFGVQAALLHPVFHPRVYLGFGLVMVFAILFGLRGAAEAAELVPKAIARPLSALLMAVVLLPPSIPAVTTGFAFGAAQEAQGNYEMLAADDVRRGLATIGARRPQVVINGTIAYAPPILPALKRYPILRDLVVRTLDNDWYWGTRLLLYFGASLDTKKADREAAIAAASIMPPDYVGAGLTLTKVNENLVVLSFGQ